LKFFQRHKKATCSNCEESRPKGLWLDLVRTVKEEYKLQKDINLDFGTLYACPTCNVLWYLNKKESSLIPVVAPDRIHEWINVPRILPEYLREQFFRIKATPPDFYNNGRDFIDLPCKVTLIDQRVIDFAIVRLQKDPPFLYSFDHKKDYITVDKVSKIEESEYALPAELRLKTGRAMEVRMGFSPSRVLGPDQKQYVLNGVTNFFRQGSIKGSQLMKVPEGQEVHELDLIYAEDDIEITYLIGHWDEGMLRARIPMF
jgi:hypothetical protein